MACACTKSRQPTGFAATPRTGRTVPPLPPAERQLPVQQQTYTLHKPDGSVATFGSKLEALAARVQAGGGTLEH